MNQGEQRGWGRWKMYWEPDSLLVVVVNPRDSDGGAMFQFDERYIDQWGQ